LPDFVRARRLEGHGEKENCKVGFFFFLDSHLIGISCLEKMGRYNLSFYVWPGILLLKAECCLWAPKPPQDSPGSTVPKGLHTGQGDLYRRTVRMEQARSLPAETGRGYQSF
jgi:hypothetical protein